MSCTRVYMQELRNNGSLGKSLPSQITPDLLIATAIVGDTEVGGKAAVAVAGTRMVTVEVSMQFNRFKVNTRASPSSHTTQSLSLLVHLNKCPRTQQWNCCCQTDEYMTH